MQRYYSVVIFDRPFEPLTYQSADEIAVGTIVQVPLGRQSCTGIIVAVSDQKPNFEGRIRSIVEIVDPLPFNSGALMATLRFMSTYYVTPLGFCLKLALPGGMMRSGTCRYMAGVLPEIIQDLIQVNGIRQQAFSKYCACRRFG